MLSFSFELWCESKSKSKQEATHGCLLRGSDFRTCYRSTLVCLFVSCLFVFLSKEGSKRFMVANGFKSPHT